MRIELRNFKGVESFNKEGERIRVTGKNGTGKSSVLRSIERALFGTMDGWKRGIVPVRVGAEDCYVELETGGEVYSRMKESGTASIPVYLRSVIFCNLFDQEARYIKETLSDIFLGDYAKEIFGEYREGNLEKTAKKIRYLHKDVLARHNKLKGKIDTYNQLLSSEKYLSLSGEELEKLVVKLKEAQAEGIKNNLEGLTLDYNNIKNAIKVMQELLEGQERTKESLTSSYKRSKKKIDDLIGGKCPLCGSNKKVEQSQLDSLKVEMEDIVTEGTNYGSKIAISKAKLERLTEKAIELEQQLKQATAGMDQQIASPEAYQQRVTLYKERLEERVQMELDREKSVQALIALNEDPIMKAYGYLAPKGDLNKKLADTLSGILKDFEIVLFEESDRDGDMKATFKVYRNGIEYKQLSRSEKLEANIMLSSAILEKLSLELPLAIDDFEVFQSQKRKDIVKILTERGIQFITAEVSSSKLKAVEHSSGPA